jgi:hypothetical protein
VTFSLETIKPSLLALLFIEIVKHKLEVLARRPKDDLIFATVKLVVMYLHNAVIHEHEPIYYVEHAAKLGVFLFGIEQTEWIEVVDATVLLNYETAFD